MERLTFSVKTCALWQEGERRRLAILDSIFRKCVMVEAPEGIVGPCWVWKGPHSGSGRGGSYGRFSFQGRTASVHRTVYAAVFGPIPPRKQIDHSCNNRGCCNPGHLVMMTHKKNQKLRDERRANVSR